MCQGIVGQRDASKNRYLPLGDWSAKLDYRSNCREHHHPIPRGVTQAASAVVMTTSIDVSIAIGGVQLQRGRYPLELVASAAVIVPIMYKVYLCWGKASCTG